MSVKIKTSYGSATVNNGKWRASNEVMRDFLIGFDQETLADEVGYHPWPDLGIAEMAIEELGGEIVETTDAPNIDAGSVEGAVF